MQIMAKTKYTNETALVTFARYSADQSVAIMLSTPAGQPLLKATSCLVEYGFTPPVGSVAIKTYSENEGVLECLIDQGVIEPATETFDGPYGPFPICKLTPAALAELA